MLTDPVYHMFYPPRAICPCFCFDMQCLGLLFCTPLTQANNPSHLVVVGLFPKSFLHPVFTSLSSLYFPNLFQGKNNKRQLHPLLPAAFGLSPSPWLPAAEVSYLPLPQCYGITSHLLSCPFILFSPLLLSSFVPHSSVVLSSHNKAMFSCVSLKPTLDLICPSNCCFISLSSVNSWNASFLVTGVPLLSPFLSYSAVTLPQLSLRYFMTF